MRIDFTIADFAADVRAPTPSAAGSWVPEAEEWLSAFVRFGDACSTAWTIGSRNMANVCAGLTGRLGPSESRRAPERPAQRLDETGTVLDPGPAPPSQEHRERLRW